MYRVMIMPLAINDISDAANWYNHKKKGLGKKFTEEIRSSISMVKKNPRISVIRYEEVRTWSVYKFPFTIHYTIDEDKKLVIILAVFHTSRNPKNFKL